MGLVTDRYLESIPVYFFFLFETYIDVAMEFFVIEMKINIYNIIQRLKLLGLSMEKMINPRFQITQIMFSMHLLSENMSLRTLFQTIDGVFLQAFVGVHME